MADLARSLTLSRGGRTKLADRLEAAGLLRCEPAPDDGRGLYAVLTEDGNELLRRMWPVYSGVLQQAFVDAVGADDARVVDEALTRVNEAARNGGSHAGSRR